MLYKGLSLFLLIIHTCFLRAYKYQIFIIEQIISLVIYNGNHPIPSIRFSFMIPAYDDVLSELNFAQISKTDKRYAIALTIPVVIFQN